MAATGAVLYAVLGVPVPPAFLLGAAFTVPAVLIHFRIEPTDLHSVTRGELRVIQLGVAAGLSPAGGVLPPLWPLLPGAEVGLLRPPGDPAPPAGLSPAGGKGR